MNESFWIMQGYETYIWSSYLLTLLSLCLLFVHSSKQFQKAKRLFGWTPKVTLSQGIKKTIDYYKNTKRL